VVSRYLGFQVPGWLAVGMVALGAHEWWHVPGWLCVGAFCAWVAKDAVLFPFVWHAYAPASGEHGRVRRGTVGVAEEPLAPSGYVRVGPELWMAERAPDSEPVAAGDRVSVLAIRGLTLLVERGPDDGR